MVSGVELNSDLQKVLWACHDYWKRESLPMAERAICFAWVVKPHRSRFKTGFHQSALARLARLGFLQKDDSSRGGNRRYYKLSDPVRLETLLQEWRLN